MRRVAPLLLALVLAGCVGPSAPRYAEEPLAPTPSPASSPAATPAASPYAGEESRVIKALAPEEVDGYRRGAGLGYAKPAELNSYPGPLHALEMADALGLSEEQRAAIEQARADMLAEAVPLGERFLAVEAALEEAFRAGDLDRERLAALLDESARIEARLRFVHLEAHLDTRDLLTRHQVMLYDEARGYASDAGGHDGHGHAG